MLVYDVTREETFRNVVKWMRNIEDVSNQLLLIITEFSELLHNYVIAFILFDIIMQSLNI